MSAEVRPEYPRFSWGSVSTSDLLPQPSTHPHKRSHLPHCPASPCLLERRSHIFQTVLEADNKNEQTIIEHPINPEIYKHVHKQG